MNRNQELLLGKKIQLNRNEKGWTLRELASKTGLSHSYINRIEQGLLSPSEDALDSLKKALGFNYHLTCDCMDTFHEDASRLYRHILYGNYTEATKVGEKIFAQKSVYEDCPIYASFYLYMLAFSQHTGKHREIRTDYYEKLERISDVFSGEEKALYMFEKGMYYYYVMSEREAAISILNEVESLSNDSNLIAFVKFFLGTLYAVDFRYYRHSLEAFDQAQQLFQSTNNFVRVMHTKSNKQMPYIYLNRFEDFEKTNTETLNYSKIKGEMMMYYVSLKNRAKYFIARREYEEVLKVFERFSDELAHGAEYFFYKIYALYQLGTYVRALHYIDIIETLEVSERNMIYLHGAEAIKHAITKGNEEGLIDKLKLFADKAYEHKEFMLIRVSFKMVSEALETHRRYKEAYTYSNTLLEIIKDIIGKVVHHEKLS